MNSRNNRKKLLLLIIAIAIAVSPAFATINKSNVVSYEEECYKINPKTGDYELSFKTNIPVSSLSIDDIINRLKTGIDQSSNGYACDRTIVYYTTPQKNKSEGITIQKMVKPVNKFANSDFITIKQAKSSYFVGISSKLQGAGVGYYIWRGNDIGKNKTFKHTFGIERVNWLNFFAKYIKNYCEQTKGIPPYIIYNQMSFLNAAGAIGKYLENHPDAVPSALTSSQIPELKNPGFFKLNPSICQESLKEIEDDLATIRTHKQTGTEGYGYTLYGDDSDKLFVENGNVINYPFISFNDIDQIMGEFFTTFMFVNNIPRGIMFSDKKVTASDRPWTTGKWPWSKRRHVERKFNASSESYDIVYAQFIQPFGSYSFTKNWSNIDLSYVASVNNFPMLTRSLIAMTPDNHQITHVFKKGGELSDLGEWNYKKEVSVKLGFKYVAFALALIAVSGLIYVGASYFALSSQTAFGFGFGNFLSQIMASPGLLIGNGMFTLGGLAFAAPTGIATASAIGGALSTAQFIGNWFTKGASTNKVDNTLFGKIKSDLFNDIISSSSPKVQQVTFIPQMINKIQPKTMVSPTIYKVILRNTPTLGVSSEVIPQDEFLTKYGTYWSMYMYANHTDLGKDFYSESMVHNWARSFIDNMLLKGTNGFMYPGDALITIMQKEWKGE
jgi:hypothetical protein